MGVWNLEITDEAADEAFDRYKNSDSDDDTPDVPVGWDAPDLRDEFS